jgi:hypothetical protein
MLFTYSKMDAVNQKSNNKLSKVLSTKLSIEDYNSFQMLTKLEYEAGLIKEESTSELLRFTIRHILNQVHINQNTLYSNKNDSRNLKTSGSNSFIIDIVYSLVLLLVISRIKS